MDRSMTPRHSLGDSVRARGIDGIISAVCLNSNDELFYVLRSEYNAHFYCEPGEVSARNEL